MTMVAAVELDNFVAPGICPRQPQSGHGRLRPRIDEADHLDVGHEIHNPPGKLDLQWTRRAVGCPFHGCLLDRFDYFRMSMARDQWAPGKNVIDIAVAIHIVKIGPLAALDEERLSAHGSEGADRRVHAARK